jgi:hypothetical protein
MCISASVTDSTATCGLLSPLSKYVFTDYLLDILQSSGSQTLGWIAMYASGDTWAIILFDG